MIKSIHATTKEPFNRTDLTLTNQQKQIFEIIKIHSQQGDFSVVIGEPGVGKNVLKEHIETLEKERDITVASYSRILHTYWQILEQLTDSFKIEVSKKTLEKELITCAYNHIKGRETLYILIDEAHLLDMHILRKLRLLF